MSAPHQVRGKCPGFFEGSSGPAIRIKASAATISRFFSRSWCPFRLSVSAAPSEPSPHRFAVPIKSSIAPVEVSVTSSSRSSRTVPSESRKSSIAIPIDSSVDFDSVATFVQSVFVDGFLRINGGSESRSLF